MFSGKHHSIHPINSFVRQAIIISIVAEHTLNHRATASLKIAQNYCFHFTYL